MKGEGIPQRLGGWGRRGNLRSALQAQSPGREVYQLRAAKGWPSLRSHLGSPWKNLSTNTPGFLPVASSQGMAGLPDPPQRHHPASWLTTTPLLKQGRAARGTQKHLLEKLLPLKTAAKLWGSVHGNHNGAFCNVCTATGVQPKPANPKPGGTASPEVSGLHSTF